MKNFFIKQTLVALFVIAGIALAISLTLTIGKNKGTFFQNVNTYKSIFSDARGIYVGSEVTIHGVRTGNVMKTQILANGKVEIHFSSLKKYDFMVNTSSITQLKTLGALGDRYVNILTTDFAAPSLEDQSIIPSEPSLDMMSFFTGNKKSPNLLNSAQEILQSTQLFLKEATKTLNKTNKILNKIENGQGTLGALINDRVLYNRVLTLFGEKPRYNFIKELSNKTNKK